MITNEEHQRLLELAAELAEMNGKINSLRRQVARLLRKRTI